MPFDLLGYFIFLSATSLLFLPESYLVPWQGSVAGAICCLLVGKISAKIPSFPTFIQFFFAKWGRWLAIFCILLGYEHYQALNLRQLAMANIRLPHSVETDFTIERILKQHHYQTVVAKAFLPTSLQAQSIYLNWNLPERPQLGERWRGELRLHPLTARLNFGGMDKQKWFFSHGITAYGKVKRAKKIDDGINWRSRLLQRALQETDGLSQQGLLMALGFGERAWLLPKDLQLYQKTNTAHLIAISGLHIGLAMWLGMLLAKGVQLFLPTRWIFPYFPYVVGIFFASFYAFLAGFAIPTIRAMVALVLVTMVQQRRCYLNKWQYMGLVLGGLLLFEPLMVLSDSFWLSVGAVMSLMIWYQFVPFSAFQWRGKPVNHISRLYRYILGLFHLQVGLLWLFTPIQLFMFGGISSLSLWVNLLIVPLFSLILVPLVLMATLGNYRFLWEQANFLLENINAWLAQLHVYWIPISQSLVWTISIFCIGTFLCFLVILQRQIFFTPRFLVKIFPAFFRERPLLTFSQEKLPRRSDFLCAYLVGSIVMFYCLWKLTISLFPTGEWRANMLDVGQGLAVLIERNGRGILYDTGASWGEGENFNTMATIEILPFLQRKGIELDELILSHDDNDHAGGVKIVQARYQNATFVSPSRQHYAPILSQDFPKKRRDCVKGASWQWQGLQFQVLSPNRIVEKAKNEDSCVLLISDDRPRLLLMGDASSQVERRLAGSLPPIDVLQAGHHGSKTASSLTFLRHIQPKAVFVSSSRWNPWKLPNKEVVERFQRQGIPLWNTAKQGGIEVVFYPKYFQIHSSRHHRLPWYQAFIGTELENRVE